MIFRRYLRRRFFSARCSGVSLGLVRVLEGSPGAEDGEGPSQCVVVFGRLAVRAVVSASEETSGEQELEPARSACTACPWCPAFLLLYLSYCLLVYLKARYMVDAAS